MKELAAMLGVDENTVLNWELRGMKPRKHMKELKSLLILNNCHSR